MPNTHIVFIVDESGSMYDVWKPTIDGFNEYIQDLKKDSDDLVAKTYVSLIKFAFTANVVYAGKPLTQVEELNTTTYAPSGGTALNDAIAYAVKDLDSAVGPDDKALVVIQTDGFENSSRETTTEQVKDLIRAYEAKGNWSFAFLGADIDAWAQAQQYGVMRSNTMSYGKGATMDTYASLASTTKRYRGASGQSVSNLTELMEDENADVEP